MTLGGALVSALAGFALVAVITNGFDQDTAGTLFATTSLFLIGVAVAQLGAEVGLVRWLPQYVVHKSPAAVRATMRAAFVPVIAASVLVGAGAALLSPWIGDSIGGATNGEVASAQILVLAAFLPIAALSNTVLAATRGMRTMRPTVAVESIGRPVLQLVLVGAAALVGAGSVLLVTAWSAPYLVALVLASAWLAVLVRTTHSWSDPVDAPTQVWSSFWVFTSPRSIATIAQIVLKRADIVLVAVLASPAEAALYTAATRFITVGQLGVQAIQQVLAPHLSALFVRGRHGEASDLYKVVTAWSMAGAWPLYLSLALLAPTLLPLFGEGYVEASDVVVVLSLAMLAATAAGAVDTVLLMSGRSWLSLANSVTAAVLNVAMNVVLIPRFGIMGAAIAWATAIIVRNGLPLIQVQIFLGLRPTSRAALYVATAALAFVGLLPWIVSRLVDEAWATPVAVAVGACLYAAALLWRRRLLRLDEFVAALRRRPAGGTEAPV